MLYPTDLAVLAEAPHQSVLYGILTASFGDKQTGWANRERWRS